VSVLPLVGFAALVAVVAGRVLPGAGWVYRAPRLGLAAWYAVLSVIVASTVAAAASVLVAWPATRGAVCAWWAWCARALRGELGPVARVVGVAVLVALLVVVAVAGGRLVVAAVRAVRRLRVHRRAHAEALTLVGRRHPELGVRVIDCAQPAAYLLGRRVVVTSGAIETLPGAQLAAVVAHERAHAAGRHQVLTDVVGVFAAVAPGVTVFSQAAAEVARLVEIRADEVAAAGHGRLTVARAIVACAQTPDDTAVPRLAGALAASGGNALERVHRLVTPPEALSRPAAAAVMAGLGALVVLPALLVAAGQAVAVLGSCLPVTC
jgi:Zn-dependent protease with chaperone function